jgi:hypothetical protein
MKRMNEFFDEESMVQDLDYFIALVSLAPQVCFWRLVAVFVVAVERIRIFLLVQIGQCVIQATVTGLVSLR